MGSPVVASNGTAQTLRVYVNIFAAFAIIDATINAIIPEVILPQFGMFADFRTAGYGDIVKFKIMPRSFYTVSLGNKIAA